VAGTQVRVADPDTGAVLGVGESGELHARGPQMMTGYLNRPADTAALWTADGWLRTGDLGHLEPDGAVVVDGRIKELIKVNGLQVAPAEVEAVLASHPAVADAAVSGRPCDRTGETPVAHVVTVAGASIDVEDLRTWVDQRLAPYKRPTVYRFVDAIPRNPSGKIQRRLLW
jgi:acyl-CoA synthetase (AMP-forming)/AMP-acid ligase II